MTDERLGEQLAVARDRLIAVVPGMTHAGLANDPAELAQWLTLGAQALIGRDYIAADPSDEPSHLALWTNDVPVAPNPWFLSAMAHGPAVPEDDAGEWHESFIGEELGDLRIPTYDLVGTPDVLAWYAGERGRPGWQDVEEVLLLAICDLVDRSLSLTDAVSVPVSVARGDEMRIWLWERPGGRPRFIQWTGSEET